MKITFPDDVCPWTMASNDITRPVLNYVLIQKLDEGYVAVATDTYSLVVVEVEVDLGSEPEEWVDLLLPAAFLTEAAKAKPRKADALVIGVDVCDGTVRAPHKRLGNLSSDYKIHGRNGDMLFPGWKRIVEHELKEPASNYYDEGFHYFNADLLQRVAHAIGADKIMDLVLFRRRDGNSPLLVLNNHTRPFLPDARRMGLVMHGNDKDRGEYGDRVRTIEQWLFPQQGEARKAA